MGAGPSGVDAPAPDNPSMIGRPLAAFAAASQLDFRRLDRLLAEMSDADLESLHRAVTLLAYAVAVERADRKLARDLDRPIERTPALTDPRRRLTPGSVDSR